MPITFTSYIDVVSSWCFWSEPAWAALKERYEGRVEFHWKIALMDKTGLPVSREQHDWFYRRSGMMQGSPFMLKSAWCDHTESEFLAPNAMAEAGKDMGVIDDRIRLAIAHAALRDGQKIGDWNVSLEIAARAGGVDKRKLLELAKSPEIEKRIRRSTAEFYELKVTQRPAFVIETEIGDRAIFSGVVKVEPLAATLESFLEDAAAYAAHAAHFGAPPAS
jgi:predicted DsbA family dithiol-disulfide isomerase